MAVLAADHTWTHNERRMLAAANARHGIVPPPQRIERSHADPPSVFHVAVPAAGADWTHGAAGGAGRTLRQATLAAVGESMERYAAARAAVPRTPRATAPGPVIGAEEFSLFDAAQRGMPGFPATALYRADSPCVEAFDRNGGSAWVPASLVLLRAAPGEPVSTSNGLALAASPALALLRAVEELVERDALMATWLHSVPARRIAVDGRYTAEVVERGGTVTCFDITPAYSPHPVALVAAALPLRGRPRHAIGAACRGTWVAAVERAWLESVQGLLFAGWYTMQPGVLPVAGAADLRSFDEHAAWYTWHPEQWHGLPLFGDSHEYDAPCMAAVARPNRIAVRALLDALDAAGVRVLHRELTTPDLRELGLHVMRAVSPDLVPLHCHEQWPHLGGTSPDVQRRYPWTDPASLRFPNAMPHPLG